MVISSLTFNALNEPERYKEVIKSLKEENTSSK